MRLSPYVAITLVACVSSLAFADVEQRDVKDFTRVTVGGDIDLELTQASDFGVEVDSDSVDLEEILTEVRNGELTIRRESNNHWLGFFWWSSWRNQSVLVRVSLPVLEELQAAGGSDVASSGTFTGKRLAVISSGGSDVQLTVDVEMLEVHTSGGSDLRLAGKAKEVVSSTSGGSDLSARALSATHAQINASGGSDTIISVVESISGAASGGSDVAYYGNPARREIETSGGADVRQLD